MTQFIEPTTHNEDARTIDGTVSIMGCDVTLIFEYEYSHKNEDYRIISAFEIGAPRTEHFQLRGMFTGGADMFAPIEEEIKVMIETVDEPCDEDDVSDHEGEGHAGAV